MIHLLSSGDSVYSRENLFDFWEDSRENVCDVYGDYRKDWLEILAVVMIVGPISSVRGSDSYLTSMQFSLSHTHTHVRVTLSSLRA